MVQSLQDTAIQEATARYEPLAQGLASAHDRFPTSHRQAVQMLTRHLEDGGHFASRGMARLVAQARAGYPEFAAIAILDPSGRVVASDPPTTEEGRTTAGVDLSDGEWLGEILRGHRTVTHSRRRGERDPAEPSRVADRRADLGWSRRAPWRRRGMAPTRRHPGPHGPNQVRPDRIRPDDDRARSPPRTRAPGPRPRTGKSLGAVGLADRQVPGLRSAPALHGSLRRPAAGRLRDRSRGRLEDLGDPEPRSRAI